MYEEKYDNPAMTQTPKLNEALDWILNVDCHGLQTVFHCYYQIWVSIFFDV